MILLVDIDGTIADNSHREGFLQGSKKDWDSFYNPELMAKDEPIAVAMEVVPRLITREGIHFLFLTGRPERTREVTVAWLAKHIGCVATPPSSVDGPHLLMRPDGDHRRADVYKEEWVTFLKKWNKPLVFIDDDERNTEMYRKHGIYLKAPECWSVFR